MQTNQTTDSTIQTSFLDFAREGNSEWWRYLWGVIIIFFVWQIGGIVFLLPIFGYAFATQPELLSHTHMLAKAFPFFWMISVLLTFAMIWLPSYVVTKQYHKRPFLSLFTAAKRMRWGRIGHGLALYGVLILIVSAIEGTIIHPDYYQFVYDREQFWRYALAILLLVPIQATAEEILFRGYILQATSLATRNFILLSVVNGVIFMLPHLFNNEIHVSPVLVALSYVVSGAFFAYITLKDNGMELAIGAHIANNVFALTLVNLADSSIQTSPLFLVTDLDPVYTLVSQVIASLVFIVVVFGLPRRPS